MGISMVAHVTVARIQHEENQTKAQIFFSSFRFLGSNFRALYLVESMGAVRVGVLTYWSTKAVA